MRVENLKQKFLHLLIISMLIIKIESYYIESGEHSEMTLNNFAFGSCFYGRHSTRLDIFKTIHKNKPELWLWLGDAAYVDKVAIWDYWKSTLDVNFTLAEQIFNISKNNEYYVPLEKEIPTIGIWDDHDFAINDGNGYFSHKEISKKLFLDFINEPEDSERRTVGRGIYTTYSFGDKSTHKTVRFILLDVRFNKTSLVFDQHPDILGEDQWKWLEDVLAQSDETFIFISSGTQILPFNRLVSESWYGNSRKRLFDLIGKYKKNGVIILSGDIHCAQILKTFCTMPEIGYDLYEITSSGLSHFLRVKLFMDHVFPNDYLLVPTIDTYNFAKININWGDDKESSSVEASIIDADDIIRTKLTIPYSKLTHNNSEIKDPNCTLKINRRFKTLSEYFEYYKNHKLETIFLIPILWIILIIYYFLKFLYCTTKKCLNAAMYLIKLPFRKVKIE